MSEEKSAKSTVRTILAGDHKEIKALFDEFRNANEPKNKEEAAESIAMALHNHLVLEERILYTRLKSSQKETTVLDSIQAEHDSMNRIIVELRRLFADLDEREYNSRMQELEKHFEHHVVTAEQEVIPSLEQSSSRQLEEIASEINHARE